MHKLSLVLLASVLTLALPASGYAQSAADVQSLSPEDRRAYLEGLSPEERAAMREKWRSERATMSEEQRDLLRAERTMAVDVGRRESRRSRQTRRASGPATRSMGVDVR